MRRRVLFTTDVVGGVWDFCITLAAGLRSRGDDVVLLALGTPTPAQQCVASQAGVRLVSEPLRLEWMADSADDVLRTREVVARLARDVRADLVHANQFAAACADVDVPVLLTVHSDVLSWRRWTLGTGDVPAEWRSYVSLVKEALSRADRIVAVSHFLANAVRDLYAVHRQIDVVHNGWPVPPEPSRAPRSGSMLAGRIWDAAKNIPLVAEAAHGWDPGPVSLAGESAHPDGGRATLPPPLQPLGFLNRTDLDGLLSRARVYISAARYDPFGLLPLQAALHGCILLLSDIPSYREVWGETATYFDPNDAADLRLKWQSLLTSASDSRAREHAQARYSADRMVSEYQRLYAEARQVVAA